MSAEPGRSGSAAFFDDGGGRESNPTAEYAGHLPAAIDVPAAERQQRPVDGHPGWVAAGLPVERETT